MARKPQKKRGTFARVARALLLDIVLIGLGLCVFALFHHVLPTVGVIVVDERNASEIDPGFAEALGGLNIGTAATQAPAITPEPTKQPSAEPEVTAEPTKESSAEPEVTTEPTQELSAEPEVTAEPTQEPSAEPEVTPEPTQELSSEPEVTAEPTKEPSAEPEVTAEPAQEPAADSTSVSDAGAQEKEAPSFAGEMVSGFAAAEPPQADAAPSATYAPGDFSALFDRAVSDTDGIRVEKDEYLSEDVSIRITTTDAAGIRFHVADIYIRNIENFRTAFANDVFGRGQREYAWDISMEKGAILSVNGDYYGARDDGVVIRNGELYRDTLYQDVCVLYRDGVMETCTADEFDCAAAVERGAWQAWSFGPMLLDSEGKAMSLFNSVVVNHNPRCGVGYYEPGHYCFVIVEGRNEHSRGATLAEFSYIFEQLGCTAAYNMDGGNTAVMTYGSRLVSEPSQGGRPVTDIIMIAEVDGE